MEGEEDEVAVGIDHAAVGLVDGQVRVVAGTRHEDEVVHHLEAAEDSLGAGAVASADDGHGEQLLQVAAQLGDEAHATATGELRRVAPGGEKIEPGGLLAGAGDEDLAGAQLGDFADEWLLPIGAAFVQRSRGQQWIDDEGSGGVVAAHAEAVGVSLHPVGHFHPFTALWTFLVGDGGAEPGGAGGGVQAQTAVLFQGEPLGAFDAQTDAGDLGPRLEAEYLFHRVRPVAQGEVDAGPEIGQVQPGMGGEVQALAAPVEVQGGAAAFDAGGGLVGAEEALPQDGGALLARQAVFQPSFVVQGQKAVGHRGIVGDGRAGLAFVGHEAQLPEGIGEIGFGHGRQGPQESDEGGKCGSRANAHGTPPNVKIVTHVTIFTPLAGGVQYRLI